MMRILLLGIGVIILLSLGVWGKAYNLFPKEDKREEPVIFRGSIYDFDGRTLAETRVYHKILVSPQTFVSNKSHISLLAKVVKEKPSSLALRLLEQKTLLIFEVPSSVSFLASLKSMPGIIVQEYSQRLYPFALVTNSLLGKISPLGRGVAGLEKFYDSFLQEPDSILRTSIDITTQKALYKDLKYLEKVFQGQEVSGAILDISSGRILAIASTGESLESLLRDTLPLSLLRAPLKKVLDSSQTSLGNLLWDLGFGEPTHIDLPGEDIGRLPPETDSLSSVWATPLQILRAVASLKGKKLYSLKIAVELEIEGKKTLLSKDYRILKISPLTKGGRWWEGGSRKDKFFFLTGLWPYKRPRLAYIFYVKGVRVRGLPLHPYRLNLTSFKKYYWVSPKKLLGHNTFSPSVMPDLRGLTLKEALEKLSKLGLKVKFQGFGITVKQWPSPGTPLKGIKECKIILDEKA